MHIVLANQWFYPEIGGGVGKYNWIIARAFRALGHEVTVIAKRWNQDLPVFLEIEGIRVHRIQVSDAYYRRRLPGLGRYVRPAQQLIYAFQLNLALRRLQEQRPADLIEFAEVNAEGFFYVRAPRSAFVIRCHTPTAVLAQYYDRNELDFDTRITSWCEKDFIRRAHALTAPSADTARVVARECDVSLESIAVVPNPVYADRFPDDSPVSRDAITILHVGRLERVKGVAVLADAIPRVVCEIPNVHFVFIGGDRPTITGISQQAELQAQLAATGVQANASFLGSVDQTALANWYQRADICVVPSLLYESFSYTCAEAMAAGKPVVASRIGGIPETVDDGVNGILVTPGNANELAEAMIALVSDPARRERMGRAGREKVASEFDPMHVAQYTLGVYELARAQFNCKLKDNLH